MGKTDLPRSTDLPARLQPIVANWFTALADSNAALPDTLVAPVSRLVACSEFAGKVLLREFPWFLNNVASFSSLADNRQLESFVAAIATSDADVANVKSELRRYRNRFLLRVLWREVQQRADLDETLQQLSLLADRLLDAATRYADRQLRPSFGQVRNAAGGRVPLVILGMGKLGGRELEFFIRY